MAKLAKNKYGQYFTPEIIANFMVDLSSKNLNCKVLEPCSGKGIFLQVLEQKNYKNITSYEIDESLKNIFNQNTIYQSFISANITDKFDLIIGNPPYIRWSNLESHLKTELQNNLLWKLFFNSLCDYLYIFILKSIELLKENGELIFICPEYWLNTTHSKNLRNYMVKNGYFECIYHFNETPIFEKVTVSLIIFKYVKSKRKSKKISIIKYNSSKKIDENILNSLKKKQPIGFADFFEIDQFKDNERWIIATEKEIKEIVGFEEKCKIAGTENIFLEKHICKIGDVCEIGNGLVSGLDSAFQLNGQVLNKNEKSKILKVVKAKDLSPYVHNNITRYIFANEIQHEEELMKVYPNFYKQLIEHKTELESRFNYSRKIKYWEWVFLRNFKLFSSKEYKIFVPCKERISNKNYFRFALAEPGLFPTQDVTAIYRKKTTKESIHYILALLNNHRTFTWLKYNGILKGNIVEFSEKPISSIPFRLINWNSKLEINIHENITRLVKEYILDKDEKIKVKIDSELDKLF